MKKWLNKCNEEGVSNGDALTAAIVIGITFVVLIVLYKYFV